MEGRIQLTRDLYSIILAANANHLNLGLPLQKKSNRIGPKPQTEDRKPQILNLIPQTLNPEP